MTKLRISYLGWFVGGGLVAYLLSRIDIRGLGLAFSMLSFKAVAGVVVFTILANALQGLRYYFFWPAHQVNLLRQIFLPFCVHSANILLPFRAGETVQPLTIKKWAPEQPLTSLIYWAAADKILEILSFLPFVALAAWVYDIHPIPALLIALVGTTVLFVWSNKAAEKPRWILLAYLTSVAHWFANLATFYFLMPAGRSALGLLVATSAASSIPGVPASLGTFEMAFVWIGKQGGLTATDATALAIAGHSISIIATLLIGLPFGALWGWPKTRERVEAQPQIMPVSQKLSNFFVYLAAFLTVFFAGAFWIPESRLTRRHKRPHRAAS